MVKINITDKTLDLIKSGYDDTRDFIREFGEYLDPKDSTKYNPNVVNITKQKEMDESFKKAFDDDDVVFNFEGGKFTPTDKTLKINLEGRGPIDDTVKELVEKGDLKYADELTQDQMNLLSIRREKQNIVNEVRKNRAIQGQGSIEDALAAIDALDAKKIINEDKILNPTTPKPKKTRTPASEKKFSDIPLNDGEAIEAGKMIDPRTNSVTTFTSLKNGPSLQMMTDNFLQSKSGAGLITQVNLKNLPAMAEFEVLSHTFRGLALRDPYAVTKLLNKDKEIMDVLATARNKFAPGMQQLLEQKQEILQNPKLNEELLMMAKQFYPNAGSQYIQNARLDLAHIFPFTETAKVTPNSSFLMEGGNPKYLYLSPSGVNRKLQTFIEGRMRNAILNLEDPTKMAAAEANLMKADELLKKLKALSVVAVDEKTAIKAGDTALLSDDPVKLTMDDYKDLFGYILEMNNIEQQVQQAIPRLQDGGTPEDEIDQETGILDYLSDKKKQFEDFTGITKADEALQNYVEEDLGGNPLRAVPVAIGNMLEAPGKAADAIRNQMNNVNELADLAYYHKMGEGDVDGANLIRNQKLNSFDKYGNILTMPLDAFDFVFGGLGKGYKQMFTDADDTTLYLDPTGIFSDASYTVEGDSNFGKIVGAGRTLGLTAAEVFLAFTPYQLLKLSKMPINMITKTIKGVVNVGAPIIAVAEGYFSYDSKEKVEEAKQKALEAAEKAEKEFDARQTEEAANVGVEGINPDNFEDGGVVGEYLPTEFDGQYAQTRLSVGGEPGQFTNPTSLALEEDFDARDVLNEPGYESIQELDDLFDITKKENRFIPRDDLAVQVAGGKGEGIKYILDNVPKWVREGKERIKMGVENILPGTREQPPGLPAVIDDTADGLTPLTKQEPGQIFYQQMEAELLQGPKVFKDKKAFFDYMQARNIGKVEVLDSEIERVIDSLTQKNMPITRETLIGVLRESPVRFVQSKGYGFLSDKLDGKQRGLKYSGYKEAGEIPNTSRERVLFVDPKDLRGDPGSVPGSVSQHNWEEPYTIAWSRLSDRDLGGAYAGKTVTFADEIQSDIFQGSQKMAGKLAAKIKYMADNNVPLDKIDNDIQREILAYFGDRKHVFRESLPSAAALKQEYDQLMSLQDQLRELANTPVPEMTDAMIEAAKKVQFQQADVLDSLTQRLNLDLNRYLFPNLPFKLRGQWADASIKRDIYEAAYRKFVLKDPNATDYYAVTPANLVTRRYSHEGTTATPAADRAADKERRIQSWVSGGMDGDIASSRYPGVGMYEFYGGPGADVVTESGKHYTSEIEKILKRIARENNVPLEVLPVRTGDRSAEVFNVVDRNTGEILGSGNTGRQADAIANDIIANSDRKVVVQRAEGFDTTDSFGIELTPSMAEAFKAYMAKGGYVNEEILLPYGD